MFKIANIQMLVDNVDLKNIARLLENTEFSVRVKKSNSNQLDSDIDSKVEEALSKNYLVMPSKSDLLVEAEGVKVGELDIVFSNNKTTYYMEIEKTNKKTLWFDYIKILTRLESDVNGIGILMCPTNYAHKIGVWNLYKEAVIYKKHLKRVFGAESLDRVAVFGYTQYAYLKSDWVEYDSSIIAKIKNS